MDLQVFLDLGLDEGEARTYLALLELGPSLASSVAKKTEIDRSVVYKKLGKLIDRGFASYHVRENRRYFQAADPAELLDLLEERESRLKELLPDLLSLKKPQPEETKVEIYKGREGAKAVMNDIIRHLSGFERKERVIYAVGYTAMMSKLLGIWYDTWTKRRRDLGIRRKYLVPTEKIGEYAFKQPLTVARVLPKDLHFPSSTLAYGRKTAIFYPQEKDFTGIIIDSGGIANSNRAFFDALWNGSKGPTLKY
jgi:sugar-specific transcriptional regulator TrmB